MRDLRRRRWPAPPLGTMTRENGDMAENALSPADELELLRLREAERREVVRKRNARMNALLRADYHGPAYPTPEQIEAKRAELMADGLPHGDRSVAKALNSTESTVRRHLGKIK